MKKILHYSLLLLSFLSFHGSLFAADPTVQATNMSVVGRGANYLTVSWTRGNGQAVLITCKPTSSSTAYPADGYGNSYSSSITYGNGTNLGSSNYVVYDGTGTSTTIYGLNANTSYTIYAWEYNTTYNIIVDDDYYYYKTTVSTNDASAYTICTEPTSSPTFWAPSSITYSSAYLSWVGGNGSYDLLTVDESPLAHYGPSDGTTYTANTTWGSGSVTGGDCYVIYSGSGTASYVYGLKSATTYRARLYDYNCTAGQQNYYYSGYVYADFTTANYPPTINSVSNQTICQDVGWQYISLSGITDGSTGETQTTSVTLSSNNSTLIPSSNLWISYSSPSTSGTMAYYPVAGQYGTAVITVTVNDNFSSTNTTTTQFTVTVLPKPSAATAFTGSTTVCAGGGNYVYTEPAIANASGYTWAVPAGWSIVGGQGTATLTVSPGLSASSGNISVYGTNGNGCGNGNAYSTAITVNAQPTTPSAGTDQDPICGSTAFLSGNSPGSGNTGTWTMIPGPPAPTIGNANANSTSVTGLANNQTYNFIWTITNGGVCPAKKDTVQLVTDFSNGLCTPAANFSYAGSTSSGFPNTVCVNTPVQFTDLSVSADSWDWDFDYTGVFGSMSSLQNPSHTFTAVGTYTVRLQIHSNTTGLDYTADQTINVIGAPSSPSAILGLFTGICANDPNQFQYSTSGGGSYVSTYNWTLPSGCNLSTNASDFSLISVLFDQTATDGNILVNAQNGCGSSSNISQAIQINELPDAAGSISETIGQTVFCQGETNVTFTVSPINHATSYVWTLPSGVSGTSSTNSITVDFTSSAVSDRIYVYGVNSCGQGLDNNLPVTVNPLPDPSGAISGLNNFDICPVVSSATFAIAPIGNATSYNWVIGNGAAFTSNATGDTIVVDFSANMSNTTIEVSGTNSCGNGVSSPQSAITFNPVVTADLCIVSVDSASTYNEIFWTKPLVGSIDSFRVYRRVSTLSNILVGTVGYNDPAYLLDSTSGANPNSNFEEYTITCVDSCGNESDSTLFHRTMFLAPPVYGGSSVTLNWNLYLGQVVNFYRIWRDTTGTGTAWELVDGSVNPGVTTWVDNNMPVTPNANMIYRVDVDWVTSCDPSRAVINTSRSNIKNQMVNPTTGIAAADISATVNVYPNPAKDMVVIEFGKELRNVRYEVYDMLGQLVHSDVVTAGENRISLNVSAFASGVYSIRLSASNGKALKKLVIE